MKAFQRDVSKAIGCKPNRISITRICAGSVIVEFEITPEPPETFQEGKGDTPEELLEEFLRQLEEGEGELFHGGLTSSLNLDRSKAQPLLVSDELKMVYDVPLQEDEKILALMPEDQDQDMDGLDVGDGDGDGNADDDDDAGSHNDWVMRLSAAVDTTSSEQKRGGVPNELDIVEQDYYQDQDSETQHSKMTTEEKLDLREQEKEEAVPLYLHIPCK